LLEKLLGLIRAGGTHRVNDLARELDTSPALVEVMLEDLGRMGYLKPVGEVCADNDRASADNDRASGETCGTCPLSGLCGAGGGGRVWTLTEKGH
jgi:hypothetical protein